MAYQDRSNMYEIMNYWLENIAPKYFDLNDLSLNRIGLFGYVNEIMAQTTESTINENSILYNELFFKRAVLPQSIYAYASHYGVTNLTAVPATMSFAIGITEDTLLKKSITEGNETYFIIDSDSVILVEDEIPFMLDYDIKVSIKKDNNGNYLYGAKYVTTNLDNPVSSIKSTSNPFLKLTKLRINLTDYIFIYVDAHQYEKIEINKSIYSKDFLEYFSFDLDVDIDDQQIANFNVYYREPNATEFQQIEKKLIDSSESEKPFCFYQYKDYNKVNISFSSITRFFRPEFNSELNFVFFKTMGASGNFKYIGDNVSINLKSSKYDYNDVVMTVQPMSDSVGGEDRRTYEQIKSIVSTMASTCGIISTETDLNKYFNSIENISKILFVKKRDDILDRLYGAFLLMTDSKGNIIPTNTTDLDLYNSDFDIIEESTKRYVLKSGARLIYQPNSRTLKHTNGQGLIKPEFEYANPFTIVVNRQPFFVEYYLTSINKTFTFDYAEVNDAAFTNFISNNIKIERDSLHDDYYHFTFSMVPNIEVIQADFANMSNDGKNTFIGSNGTVVCKGIIYDSDNGSVTHYFNIDMVDYKPSEKRCYFEGKIKTDDYISVYSGLRIVDNLVNVREPNKLNPLIYATHLSVGIAVFLKEDKPMTSTYHKYIPNMEEYSLSNVFKVSEEINLINNFQKSMYSSIIYEKDETGEIYYHIKEVPVVRYDYIHIKEYAKEFISKFLSDFSILNEKISLLTNAFNLSVKLFNTYGKSYYFYVNEKITNKLDRVNLTIKLRITLNPNKIMDENLKQSIRDFIRQYIEEVNDDINLYISNLIKALEVNFKDIDHMQFEQINSYGSEVQSIEKNFPTSDATKKNQLKDFVPEFLNTNKTYDGYDSVTHDIEVQFI